MYGRVLTHSTRSTTIPNGERLYMMTENYSSSIVIPGAQAGLSWLTVLKKREPTEGL